MKVWILIRLGSLVLCAPFAGAAVPLHLEPNPDSVVVIEIPENDEALRQVAHAAGDWLEVRYSGPYTGYVSSHGIDVSEGVSSGTPIYLEPSHDAAILAVIDTPGEVEVIETGDWTKVSLRKSLRLFVSIEYLRGTAGGSAQVTDASGKPVVGSRASSPVAEEVAQNFEGRLVEAKRILFFKKPPYPYALEDEKGKRIAYLDLEAVVISQPFKNYVGRKVEVYGTIEAENDGRRLVIHAVNMR